MFQQNDGSFNVAWRRSKPKASLDGFGSESEGALPPLTATGDEPASDRSVDSAAATGDGLGESMVMVTGRIHYTRWTDQNGTERYGCEIIAEQVDFLAKAKEAKPTEASETFELALAE